jgi:protein-tyrosine phosphatase
MIRASLLLTSCVVSALFAASPTWAKVADPAVVRAEPGKVTLTWISKSPVDVYVATKADAAVEQAKLVSDDNKKGRVTIDAASPERLYFLLKDTRDGAVTEVAERLLPLEQGSNFRDLGGYETSDGKYVKWGKLYRSGGTPMLTDNDLKQVAALDLTDMVDLRSSEERTLAPTRIGGVKYSAVGYSLMDMMGANTANVDLSRMDLLYRRMPEQLAPQFKVLFDTLLEDQSTVAFNCSAGQDRTGIASALILTALGVPRETVVADYHRSTEYRRPMNEMPKIDPAVAASNPAAKFFAGYQKDPKASVAQPLYDGNQKSLVLFALEEIETKWGSVDGYLQSELGVGPAEIAKLRAKYLE